MLRGTAKLLSLSLALTLTLTETVTLTLTLTLTLNLYLILNPNPSSDPDRSPDSNPDQPASESNLTLTPPLALVRCQSLSAQRSEGFLIRTVIDPL